MRKISILIISEIFPPDKGTGALRWGRFYESIDKDKFELSVISTHDQTSMAFHHEGHICRVKSAFNPWQLAKDFLQKRSNSKSATRQSINDESLSSRSYRTNKIRRELKKLIVSFFYLSEVPIRYFWAKTTQKQVIDWATQRNPDIIIGTFPGFGASALARGLSDALDKPYIIDYRDPFTNFYFFTFSEKSVRYRMLRKIEKYYNDGAAKIISINQSQTKKLFLSDTTKVSHIPNCYVTQDDPKESSQAEGNICKIVYTGTATSIYMIDIFVKALTKYHGDTKIEFHYYGSNSEEIEYQIQHCDYSSNENTQIFIHGMVSREQSLSAQKSASILLVSGCRGTRSSNIIVTGKIMEYIERNKFIIGICENQTDEIFKFFDRTQVGKCFTNYHDLAEFLNTNISKNQDPITPSPNITELLEYNILNCTRKLETELVDLYSKRTCWEKMT